MKDISNGKDECDKSDLNELWII